MIEISYIQLNEIKKVKKIDTDNENYDNPFIGDKVKSRKMLFSLYNFNKIPPIIGIILSTNTGTSIITYQYNSTNRSGYGKIDLYLKGCQDRLLDLITMYLSSLNTFADNVNIENLRYVGIGGSNIKIKVFFKLKEYMIIVFLNAHTDLSVRIQDHILDHFNEIFENHNYVLENYNDKESAQIRKDLEISGQIWLNELNRFYIKVYEKIYIAKDKNLEKFMANVDPVITETVESYLKYVPEDIKTDICREINEKINDKLSKCF